MMHNSERKNMLSVIVPVYNNARFLHDCLESLVSQTYPFLEIILVNDGSTDESGNICNIYAEKHPDKIIVIHKKNSGVSDTRNRAIDIANGKFIGFVDSDDWCDINMFEIMVNTAMEHNADLVSCSLCREKEDASPYYTPKSVSSVPEIIKCGKKDLLLAEIAGRGDVRGYSCNKLFRRELLGDLRFDTSISCCEDLKFCVEYAIKCSVSIHICNSLYHYRISSSSCTHNYDYKWYAHQMGLLKPYEFILPIFEEYAPNYVWKVQYELLKLNLNLLGRSKFCNSTSTKPEVHDISRLKSNISKIYPIIMKSNRISSLSKVNIFITRLAPSLTLIIKQHAMKFLMRN